MKGRITVQLKNGVLDVEGTAIARALATLGFDAPEVRVGRVFEVELGASAEGDRERGRALLEEMAGKLLANPVMERFTVEIVDEPDGVG